MPGAEEVLRGRGGCVTCSIAAFWLVYMDHTELELVDLCLKYSVNCVPSTASE